MVVPHRSRRLQCLRNVVGVDDAALLGRMGPHAGEAVGLQLEVNRKVIALTRLFLANTQMTDKGLAHFKNCKNLQILEQRGSKVTKAGLDDFRNLFPKCKIDIQPDQLSPLDNPAAAKVAATDASFIAARRR